MYGIVYSSETNMQTLDNCPEGTKSINNRYRPLYEQHIYRKLKKVLKGFNLSTMGIAHRINSKKITSAESAT